MKQNEHGFTLVELAISLVVIGLLIGGLLKGQDMLENARQKTVIRDISAIEAASVQFYERFDAIAGDFINPSVLPDCGGTCLIAGNNDGNIDADYETSNFAIQLNLMGYVQLKWRDGYAFPFNVWSGIYRPVHWNTFADPKRQRVRRGNYLTISDSPHAWSSGPAYYMRVSRTAGLDAKLDDGKPLTGSMQIDLLSASQEACYDTVTLEYLSNKSLRTCNGFIYLKGANY